MAPSRAVVSALLLLVAMLGGAGSAAEPYEESRDGFTVLYHARRRSAIGEIFRVLGEAREAVCGRLGIEAPPAVTLRFCESAREFHESIGLRVPWYVAAVAVPGERRVAVEWDIAFPNLRRVLAHELCHIYLHDSLGERAEVVPLWMEEAVAKHVSGEWTESDEVVLQEAVLGGKLLGFESIERDFPSQHRAATVAYAQSATFLAFAEERHGPQVLGAYLDGVRGGLGHREALEAAAGRDLDSLEAEWREYLRHRFRRRMLADRVDELIFSAMALLLLVCAGVVWARRRRWSAGQDAEESTEEPGNGTRTTGYPPRRRGRYLGPRF